MKNSSAGKKVLTALTIAVIIGFVALCMAVQANLGPVLTSASIFAFTALAVFYGFFLGVTTMVLNLKNKGKLY